MLLSEVDTRLAVVSKKRLPVTRLGQHKRLRLDLLFGLDRALRGPGIILAATINWDLWAVNLPMAIVNFEAWKHFVTFTKDRGPGLSSFWHIYNVTCVVLRMPELWGAQFRLGSNGDLRRMVHLGIDDDHLLEKGKVR